MTANGDAHVSNSKVRSTVFRRKFVSEERVVLAPRNARTTNFRLKAALQTSGYHRRGEN